MRTLVATDPDGADRRAGLIHDADGPFGVRPETAVQVFQLLAHENHGSIAGRLRARKLGAGMVGLVRPVVEVKKIPIHRPGEAIRAKADASGQNTSLLFFRGDHVMSQKPLVPADISPSANIPATVPLGIGGSMDLTWLPEEQRKALLTDYARGVLDVSKKASELGVEVTVLRNNLADATKQVSEAGNSVTVTHVQNSQFGRTEIIMGNTEKAGKGELTKTQTGERDWIPIYVVAGLVALVLIAIVLVGAK